MNVSLGNADCNRVAFGLSMMAELQALLRPLAPDFMREWRTFPHDRKDRIPIGESMFGDIPERLFGEEVPSADDADSGVIEKAGEDLGHR